MELGMTRVYDLVKVVSGQFQGRLARVDDLGFEQNRDVFYLSFGLPYDPVDTYAIDPSEIRPATKAEREQRIAELSECLSKAVNTQFQLSTHILALDGLEYGLLRSGHGNVTD